MSIRYIPGTDPLAPMPLTEAERDDLVRRARESTRRAQSMAWRRCGADGRLLSDDPELS